MELGGDGQPLLVELQDHREGEVGLDEVLVLDVLPPPPGPRVPATGILDFFLPPAPVPAPPACPPQVQRKHKYELGLDFDYDAVEESEAEGSTVS